MRRKQIYIAEREELVIRGLDMLFKTLPEEVSIFGYGRDSEEVLQDFTFHTPDILFIDEMLMFHQTMPLYVFLSIKYPQTSTVLMSSEALLPEKRNTHTDYYISKATVDSAVQPAAPTEKCGRILRYLPDQRLHRRTFKRRSVAGNHSQQIWLQLQLLKYLFLQICKKGI